MSDQPVPASSETPGAAPAPVAAPAPSAPRHEGHSGGHRSEGHSGGGAPRREGFSGGGGGGQRREGGGPGGSGGGPGGPRLRGLGPARERRLRRPKQMEPNSHSKWSSRGSTPNFRPKSHFHRMKHSERFEQIHARLRQENREVCSTASPIQCFVDW